LSDGVEVLMPRAPWDWLLAGLVVLAGDVIMLRAATRIADPIPSSIAPRLINPGLVAAVVLLEISLFLAASRRGLPRAFWLGFLILGCSYVLFYFGYYDPESKMTDSFSFIRMMMGSARSDRVRASWVIGFIGVLDFSLTVIVSCVGGFLGRRLWQLAYGSPGAPFANSVRGHGWVAGWSGVLLSAGALLVSRRVGDEFARTILESASPAFAVVGCGCLLVVSIASLIFPSNNQDESS
jgi:hypothetical protein